jgi:hypothetical protein
MEVRGILTGGTIFLALTAVMCAAIVASGHEVEGSFMGWYVCTGLASLCGGFAAGIK